LRLLGHGEGVVEAALNARWEGRLEVFQRGSQRVLLDGAHNPAGARVLTESLPEFGFERDSLSLIFGAMGRKNVAGLLEPLLPFTRHLHFVSPGALGADPETLRARFGGTAHRSLQSALDTALEQSESLLVAGSLYLVGSARAALLKLGFEAQ
jgi:dihydrofolate synthase / folylpolyglutamate synthase